MERIEVEITRPPMCEGFYRISIGAYIWYDYIPAERVFPAMEDTADALRNDGFEAVFTIKG